MLHREAVRGQGAEPRGQGTEREADGLLGLEVTGHAGHALVADHRVAGLDDDREADLAGSLRGTSSRGDPAGLPQRDPVGAQQLGGLLDVERAALRVAFQHPLDEGRPARPVDVGGDGRLAAVSIAPLGIAGHRG